MVLGVGVTILIKSQEADIDRFARLFFETFNIKDYELHESLHYGGIYYLVWFFGIEAGLYRNWDLDLKGPTYEEFPEYNYYFQFYHDMPPANVSIEVIEEVLHEYLCQHIAFTLDVETAYKREIGKDKFEIRSFRKNPDYRPDKGIPAILTTKRLIS